MTIRKQIIRYVSSTIILLVGISFVFIYTLFSEYREEEFQQRQKEKIRTTLKFLTDVEEMNESIAQAMDKITIHDFYDEKLLIYNAEKKLIHSSIDDLPISISKTLLNQLSPENPWIETKEEQYDVIGAHVISNGKEYYGISKAYDEFGFTKLYYLQIVLLSVFILISLVVLIVSFYLAKKITSPIRYFTDELRTFSIENKEEIHIPEKETNVEIEIWTKRFNELIKRTKEAFSFQKNAVNHISHELKTPIAILVSNFDKMEKNISDSALKEQLIQQKERTKSLGDIIQTLLDITKMESPTLIDKTNFRVDEAVFDLLDELQAVYPNFAFEINYSSADFSDSDLVFCGNKNLIKTVFSNLLINSILYNSSNKSSITFSVDENYIHLKICNAGPLISEKERPFIFNHFFRGENSAGKSGFGLGLVLVKKIIDLHQGCIIYSIENDINQFILSLPKAQ